jgi:hypothetical protein
LATPITRSVAAGGVSVTIDPTVWPSESTMVYCAPSATNAATATALTLGFSVVLLETVFHHWYAAKEIVGSSGAVREQQRRREGGALRVRRGDDPLRVPDDDARVRRGDPA